MHSGDWDGPEEGPEDREAAEVCAACSASISLEPARSFAFGSGNALCWQCATERGGRYDADRESWDRAPDLAGLPDEAYGASPHEIRRGR